MAESRKRITTRIDNDLYEKLEYFAKKNGVSVSEYIENSIEHMIKWENSDYDLPRAEITRLNQLIESIAKLDLSVQGLTEITVTGFDGILSISRGDSYLTT